MHIGNPKGFQDGDFLQMKNVGIQVRVLPLLGGKLHLLVGHLFDQAALSGVLNTIYDLHLPLLSLENLDEPAG